MKSVRVMTTDSSEELFGTALEFEANHVLEMMILIHIRNCTLLVVFRHTITHRSGVDGMYLRHTHIIIPTANNNKKNRVGLVVTPQVIHKN